MHYETANKTILSVDKASHHNYTSSNLSAAGRAILEAQHVQSIETKRQFMANAGFTSSPRDCKFGRAHGLTTTAHPSKIEVNDAGTYYSVNSKTSKGGPAKQGKVFKMDLG